MIIHGCDFDFSSLNANDMDRMFAAQEKQQTRAQTEGKNYSPTGAGYPAWLRFQCRILMDYLDEVLGEGASAKLGLTGDNFNDCLAISKEFADALKEEQETASQLLRPDTDTAAAPKLISAPMNREQRRAAAKAHPAVADFRAQEASKDTRKQLLAALKAVMAELENA